MIKVLDRLLCAAGPVYGFDLLRETRLKSGTLYPLLDRLEHLGWVTSHWEDTNSEHPGRPRRRYYQLTAYGAHQARETLIEYTIGEAAWLT